MNLIFNRTLLQQALKKMQWTPFMVAALLTAFVAPALINFTIWKVFVVSGENRFHELERVHSLYRMKPQMEALLRENNLLMKNQDQGKSLHRDPTEAVSQLHQIANQCQVHIEEVSMKDNKVLNGDLAANSADQPHGQMDANIQLLGSFQHLVDWIRAVESEPGFLIENWQIRPSDDTEGLTRLYLDLKIVTAES